MADTQKGVNHGFAVFVQHGLQQIDERMNRDENRPRLTFESKLAQSAGMIT
jgi:hypothetical protein